MSTELTPEGWDTRQIEQAVKILNRAFSADPAAVRKLIGYLVPASIELACLDHIVNEDEKARGFQASGLGLLNGVLGPLTGGIVVVLMLDGEMKGFGYQKSYSR
jgi:hypothetical protein